MNPQTRLIIMIAIIGVLASGVLTFLKTPPSQKTPLKELTTENIQQDKYRGLTVTGDQNVYSDRDASAERSNTILIVVSIGIVCIFLGSFMFMRYIRGTRRSAGMGKENKRHNQD